jgi:multidrug efflux pump subunit AcrA (membrane-fusion protein)
MERVFTVTTDGRAVLHLVKVGGAHDNRLEILAGLTPGDRIILDSPASLRDGQSVEEGR